MGFKEKMSMLRLPFLTATFIPVLLGSVIGWYETGTFSWWYFFLCVLGISFLHIGTNVANDYFDHRSRNDWINETPTKFSGGSRAIQKGIVSPKATILTALLFFALGGLIGLYLNSMMGSNVVLWLGIIGVFCGFFYTASPICLGYRGVGEIIVGLCFGPLVLIGSCYLQTYYISFLAVSASVPVAILIFLVLLINEFPDYEADLKANKKTLVVRLGKEKAIRLYHNLMVSVYAYTLFCMAIDQFPRFTTLVFLSVPLAVSSYVVSRKNYMKVDELLAANGMTIGLHFAFGILLTIGFLLEGKV